MRLKNGPREAYFGLDMLPDRFFPLNRHVRRRIARCAGTSRCRYRSRRACAQLSQSDRVQRLPDRGNAGVRRAGQQYDATDQSECVCRLHRTLTSYRDLGQTEPGREVPAPLDTAYHPARAAWSGPSCRCIQNPQKLQLPYLNMRGGLSQVISVAGVGLDGPHRWRCRAPRSLAGMTGVRMPRTAIGMLYRDVRAVMKSVLRSKPPNVRLAGPSGTLISSIFSPSGL